ncbi:MAG: DoxX family protein, partial [Planctomycetaceae bacterium]|nr:DoxX family protein [Planctomycetaceae bacterium]
SLLAVVLIVVVRLCIGWQFAYEGLWKLNSQSGPQPWTAAGYLKNASGPLRGIYRDMSGDPDELNWLDYKKVDARWNGWYGRLQKQHPDLTKRQKQKLNELLNGAPQYRVELKQLPAGVKFGGSLAKVARFDAKSQRLIVNGSSHPKPEQRHLIPAERDSMLKLAKVVDDPAPEDVEKNEIAKAYREAVNIVYQRSARLGIKEQALALLSGDPERATQIYEDQAGTIDHKRIGNIELYQVQLKRYEKNLAAAKTAFQHDHLQKQWAEIQLMRADLVGPIKALDTELKVKARKLLTAKQLARGPVPTPMVGIALKDQLTMWALLIIGVLLMTGLFSRLSAVAAAGLLMSFYLAMPPWPGFVEFQAAAGPEHSYIVNKNLIEIFALLAIAALPTGQWFGLDAIISRLCGCCKEKPLTTTENTPAAASTTKAKSDTYAIDPTSEKKQPTG